jgi:DNA-binding response OmpR family regulator
MILCLVSEDALTIAAVRVSCPPPVTVQVHPLTGLVDAKNTLSEQGRAIVDAAEEADLLLFTWDLALAPVINTLCYHVRLRAATPAVALVRGGHEEMVAALAAGADDALAFPVYASLLQAKILAYHRLVDAVEAHARLHPADSQAKPDVLSFGALRLDRTTRRFSIRNQVVDLTPREFSLLNFLIERRDAATSRDQLLQHVWGLHFDTGTNLVDVYMHFLRRKLEAHGVEGLIQTVRGFGYRLVLPGQGRPAAPEEGD